MIGGRNARMHARGTSDNTAGERSVSAAERAAGGGQPRVAELSARRRSVRGLLPDVALMVGLSGVSVVCLSLVFPPRSWWPLALVGLVPWTVAVCRVERPWLVHWGSFLLGSLFFLVNLTWLEPVTGLGYVALAIYLGLYWPLAAWAVRTGRRAGISPIWTLPVVWVACEFLRGWVMTGFPWLYLAHAFSRHIAFIQVCDLVGAWGVTFLAVMVNAVIVEWILRWWPMVGHRRSWLNPAVGSVVLIVLLAGDFLYGRYRLKREEFRDGPRVAVIQEDFPLSSTPPYSEDEYVIFARYLTLAAQAAREKPDLIAFPETAWSATQNIGFLERPPQDSEELPAGTWPYGKMCHQAISAFARGDYPEVNRIIASFENALNPRESRGQPRIRLPRLPPEGGPPVTVLVGAVSVDVSPEQAYPRIKRYNSVLVYNPDGRQRRVRYDKIHLVPFGEVVPFRNTRVWGIDLHWLYRWLNRLSPFSNGGKIEYSLWSGTECTVFPLEVGGKTWRFGTPICYEDTVPALIRRFAWERGGGRRADFLVNVSNDGWFQHSAELPQHLAICIFRAVENRVAIARSVNTGISGFIDPSGRLYNMVEKHGRLTGPGIIGYRIAALKIDQRTSFYGRWGDWFAITCVVLSAALWAGAIITRWILAARARVAQWFQGRAAGQEVS